MIARRQRGAGNFSRTLLRLVLIVCTWQGPLPYLHSHAAAVDTAASGAGTSGAGTSGAGTSGAGTSGAGTSGAGASGSGASGSGENSAWLVEHLRTWHRGGEACPEECLRWHMHLAYPHPSEDGKPGPRPAEDRLSTVAASDAELLSPERGLSTRPAIGAADLHGREIVPTGLFGRTIAAHFYDGFAPTLALPLRFCVARR